MVSSYSLPLQKIIKSQQTNNVGIYIENKEIFFLML